MGVPRAEIVREPRTAGAPAFVPTVLPPPLRLIVLLAVPLLLPLAACTAPPAAQRQATAHANAVVRVRFTARRPAGAGAGAGAGSGAGPGSVEIRRALGSGFLLGPAGHVVTSHHGIDLRGYREATYMVVVDEGAPTERTYPARLLHHDVGGDLAVLALLPPFGELPTLALAEHAAPGQPVHALGYPRQGAFRATTGTVLAIRPATRFQSAMVEADAPVATGNSGGPLVDADGRVVGVVVRSNGRGVHAVPVDYLRRRLRQWHIDAP